MEKATNQQIIQSFAAGISLLELIIQQQKPLNVHEIQALSNMKTSNLYKYLNTLTAKGLLEKNDTHYTVGATLFHWNSLLAAKSQSLLERVSQKLEMISTQTGLTALIAVPTVKGPLVTTIFSAHYGVNIGAQIGQYLPEKSSSSLIQQAFEAPLVMKEPFVHASEPLVSHISSCSMPIREHEQLVGMLTLVGFDPLIPKKSTDEKIQFCQQLLQSLAAKA